MAPKTLIVLFAIALFLCPLCSTPAHAQTNSCTALWYCSWYTLWGGPGGGCQPAPPVGAYNLQILGDWTEVFTYLTTACVPPDAPPPCCPHCGCGNVGGSPISLVDGNTFIEETDVRIPGLSGGLSLSRDWISRWPSALSSFQVGLFGPNWRSTYEERIFTGDDHYVKYARNDGSFWIFAYAGAAYAPVAPANATATLTLDSNFTFWTLTFQNGEKRIFNYLGGLLTSIVDRNGNATQLTYDAINRLITVTDPGGRHLYLGYQNNSSYVVTSVTSDVGISLSYAYDSQGRLSQVTEPDLTTVSFAYDSNSRITTVTDSAGKVLESHTYDSQNRGLTSSRANGVESITVSY